MSFRLKTILGIAFIEGVLLLTLIWTGLDLVHESLEDELTKRASAIATLFATTTKDPVLASDLASLESFTTEVMKNPGLVYARVIDQGGVVLAEQGDAQALEIPFNPDSNSHDLKLGDGVFDASADIYEGGKKYGQVQVGLSVARIRILLAEAKSNATVLAVLEMSLVALFSFVLGSWLTRQIKALEIGAQKITGGEFGYQIEVTGNDELAKTTRVFNTMSHKVGQLYIQLSGAYDELQARVIGRTSELNLIYRISQILVDLDKPMEDIFAEVTTALTEMLPESSEINARIVYQGLKDQVEIAHGYKVLASSDIINQGKLIGILEISCPADSQLLKSDDFRTDKQPLLKAICQDISTSIAHRESLKEQQNMEIQLRHAQKLEAVGQLAAGIAHEINTPTQFINDNMHFLQQTFEDYHQLFEYYSRLEETHRGNNQHAELLEEIKGIKERMDLEYLQQEAPLAIEQSLDGLARVSKIVQAMKEFSHPGVEGKVPTDLNTAIDTTLNVSRSEWKYHAEIERDFDLNLPKVMVLPGEFNQVLLNLIINAAHAIEATGDEREGKILVRTYQKDNSVYVEVKDNGSGIPGEIMNRIFEPFFTTKDVGKGSGQGLAIAYSIIVDKHKGALDVKSEAGKGSLFTIRLPLN